MEISYVQPLSRAWERMRQILFDPFELAKWLVLGFSAWLAGLAGGGGGSTAANGISDEIDRTTAHGSDVAEVVDVVRESLIWLPLVLLGVLAIIAIALVVLWVSSRAKFIFLDNVVHNRAHIVEPWHRLKNIGDSLFLWRLGFFAAFLGVLLLIAGVIFIPAATLSFSDALRGLSFAGILIGAMTVALLGIVVFFVVLLLENFVIPIMYKFDLKATEAWRYFLPWLKSYGGWFAIYGLLILVAAVLLQMLVAMLCLFTCCIVLLPYVGTVILLPVWVLYRAYGIEFLAQFHPDFDLFLSSTVRPAPLDDVVADPSETDGGWPDNEDE